MPTDDTELTTILSND